jgi:hypothetical protein
MGTPGAGVMSRTATPAKNSPAFTVAPPECAATANAAEVATNCLRVTVPIEHPLGLVALFEIRQRDLMLSPEWIIPDPLSLRLRIARKWRGIPSRSGI